MAIKNSSHIKGVTFGDIELKIGQYADDTFLLLDGSEHSLRESVALLKEFYKCSNLKINVDKTQVAWLGSNRQKKCNMFRLEPIMGHQILSIGN